MEKIGQAFLWLKSKAEDLVSYLSHVTTKFLDGARRFFQGITTSILNPAMEKIGQAFLWLKSKAEDLLSYLSNVTTKCLDGARRFSEGFKEKLDETIARVAGILRNFPKNIVTYLVKVLLTLMLKMLKLMFNLGKSELQRRFAEILCKVNHLYALVEGFLGLVLPYESVSVDKFSQVFDLMKTKHETQLCNSDWQSCRVLVQACLDVLSSCASPAFEGICLDFQALINGV